MKKQVEAHLPTKWGNYNMVVYSDDPEDIKPHFALIHKDIDASDVVAVRIHSECLTGDLVGSKRCDCGEQLEKSMDIIEHKKGILLYLRQEGRGIGLINKLKAYNLQDQGLNTVDANLHLGMESDARDYKIALEILKDLGVTKIDLITNNPDKIKALEESNIKLRSRIPVIIAPGEENKTYLKDKQELMGHLLK